MGRRRMIDLMISCVCLAIFAVTWFYPQEIQGGTLILWISGILSVAFAALAFFERKKPNQNHNAAGVDTDFYPEVEPIREIVLLSEENTELMVWDLYGKTALVIGRDIKENRVDIDLSHSAYASMVEIEHAVLNFSAGYWYVEDLGSRNGIRIKKADDGFMYQLSTDTPCRLEAGDCLYVGLNRLQMR